MATKASTNLSAAKAKAVAKPAPAKPAPSKGSSGVDTKAALSALSGITKSLGALVTLLGQLGGSGSAGSGPYAGNRSDASYMAEGRSGTSNTGQRYVNGKPVSEEEFNAFLYGNKSRGLGDTSTSTSTSKSELSQADRDAFALLADTFKAYGLDSLVPEIQGYMQNNIGPEEARVLLKQTNAYKTRFAGNETRYKAGLNVLSEAEYLGMEDKYSQLLKQYGQQGLATKNEFATLIGADVSAVELNSRLNMAVTRVQQADPAILKALKTYYPGISDTDLVGYFLAPEKKLPELEQKVTASEIAAAATQYGLATPSLSNAEELAKLGVDQQAARQGYQSVAQVLPTGEKLGQIYGVGYDQTTAESEFLKGNASAQRKRRQLAELEAASFGGQSGVSTTGAGALAKASTGVF